MNRGTATKHVNIFQETTEKMSIKPLHPADPQSGSVSTILCPNVKNFISNSNVDPKFYKDNKYVS